MSDWQVLPRHALQNAMLPMVTLIALNLGRLVEVGTTSQVLHDPQHPYTKALLSVVPAPNPRLRRTRQILQGETPNAADIPFGCRFHPRCPVVMDKYRFQDPRR